MINLLKANLKLICLLFFLQYISCIYVYKKNVRNTFLGDIVFKAKSNQAMVFCMGGFENTFTYIRKNPFPSTELDTTNLFKLTNENKKHNFYLVLFEHTDFGTPKTKLPIMIMDTNIIDIDSISYGKHAYNCSTIYFSLKKEGQTQMIVNMSRFKKDTILLKVDDEGLIAINAKKKCKGRTKWLGVIPINN